MKIKNSNDFISIEEAKMLFANVNSLEEKSLTHFQILKSHWQNAKSASTAEQLINMLKNHMRIYEGRPSASGFVFEADRSPERKNLMVFIQRRLKNEFDVEFDAFNMALERTGMKAVDIEWDVDCREDLEVLPTEIEIPIGMEDEDEISNYISDVTGYCHKGYSLIEIEKTINKNMVEEKPTLSEMIEAASGHATESYSIEQLSVDDILPER